MNQPIRWVMPAITACIAVTLTVSMGLWQLRRAAQKEAIAASIQSAAQRPPLTGTLVRDAKDVEPLMHQQVKLRGEWLASQTVYLENRQMRGKVGFYVVTPFQLHAMPTVLMVQRGWAPRNFVERDRLPEVHTQQGLVEIVGRISLPPSKLYQPGTAASGPIRQNLDFDSFRQETGLAMRTDLSIVQTGAASDGLLREWPQINLGVEKHYGYAVQWFALSALIVGLFFWFQLRPLMASPKDSASHV